MTTDASLPSFLVRTLALVIVGRGVVIHFHLYAVGQQFTGSVVADGILVLDKPVHVSKGQSQRIRLGIAGDDVMTVHRVQCAQHLNVDVQNIGNLVIGQMLCSE